MSRIIRREAKVPKVITQENAEFPMKICACGLTQQFPYCDKTHLTIQEEEGKLYEYYDGEPKEVRVEGV
ncbi:CDGSH iron-sulfur domain-containing protein [Effusibacillus consociatus]|uniref:CDGSH iron-sulfur domain-containing protein n=1 Tax=Effusibacillus consociatus TaxID=1117041 RepID=A0ABV9Q218_9BACL